MFRSAQEEKRDIFQPVLPAVAGVPLNLSTQGANTGLSESALEPDSQQTASDNQTTTDAAWLDNIIHGAADKRDLEGIVAPLARILDS